MPRRVGKAKRGGAEHYQTRRTRKRRGDKRRARAAREGLNNDRTV